MQATVLERVVMTAELSVHRLSRAGGVRLATNLQVREGGREGERQRDRDRRRVRQTRETKRQRDDDRDKQAKREHGPVVIHSH